jgi:hypothetical protein
MRVAEQLTTQETESPSQKDKEFDKKLRLKKKMIFVCVDTLPSLDYPVRIQFTGKIVLYIEYHIRAANDIRFTGCSTVYSFVPISQGGERLSLRE